MFSTKKDFAVLARQVRLSSRGTTTKETISVDVYQVRLWKLIHTPDKSDLEAIAQTFQCNPQELLHTIVALYDRSLSEIGGETIYDTVCERKTVTILVVIDNPDIKSMEKNDISPVVTDEEDCLDTLEEELEYPDSVFHKVFSDSSSSDNSSNEDGEEEEADNDDDDDDDDDERDYSIGLGKYLKKVKGGKLNLHRRLIACLSFQKTTIFPLPAQEEHVLDLQLVACRKKYRGNGIGRHLMKLLMNRDYIGEYDAIITASDQKAIDFYRKFGFTEDSILLSKYKDIGDCWTNTTKMCYLPPYSVVHDDPIRSLTMMDEQFQKWQKGMFTTYQNQAALFNRLKNEMIGLHAKINAQEQTIISLNRERFLLVKENAALKAKLSAETPVEMPTTDSEFETQQMIQQMEKMSMINEKLLIAQMSLLAGDDCNSQMAVEFCTQKLKHSDQFQIKAKKISNDAASIALYQSSSASFPSGNQKNETLLFYLGHHEHLDIIAHAGFTNEDFLYGSFGKGLYFRSNLPEVPGQKVLLCKAALGRVELISKSKNKTSIQLKRNPDYDSVKILDLDVIDESDEIVIFDSHLALPLFLITLE